MNSFDTAIETFLTKLSFGFVFNHAIKALTDLYTFKGLVLIPVLWWIWFQPGERRERQREMVIATIVSSLLALATGRLLADLLPFRVRPLRPQPASALCIWLAPGRHAANVEFVSERSRNAVDVGRGGHFYCLAPSWCAGSPIHRDLHLRSARLSRLSLPD
jgi:hypothetical protein